MAGKLWWLFCTFVLYPLQGRCAWCGFPMVADKEDLLRVDLNEASTRSLSLRGPRRWACYGCTEYGDG